VSQPPAAPPPEGRVRSPERAGPAHSPRSGAHRPRRPVWHDIAPALVVLLAVVAVLVAVVTLKDSVLGSSSTSSSGPSVPGDEDQQPAAPTAPTSTATATSTPSATATSPAPTVDKNVRVHVWNATSRSGLAAGAATKLTGKGWRASPAGNQSGYGDGTRVFYTRPALRLTAKAVAKALGGYPVKLSTAYGSGGVVVVLGSDYQA
jgi:hypothetical protein